MRGPLSRWILSRVLASGLAFEEQAIDAYRGLRDDMKKGGCGEQLQDSLCHLLEEEETHKGILSDAAAGKLAIEDLERIVGRHAYSGMDHIVPLTGAELEQWRDRLAGALDHEEQTWIFYGNLRRMSKIPAVKKAFEVLASMEKEHVDILRKLLGKS